MTDASSVAVNASRRPSRANPGSMPTKGNRHNTPGASTTLAGHAKACFRIRNSACQLNVAAMPRSMYHRYSGGGAPSASCPMRMSKGEKGRPVWTAFTTNHGTTGMAYASSAASATHLLRPCISPASKRDEEHHALSPGGWTPWPTRTGRAPGRRGPALRSIDRPRG
jgi:hypothetical protein